MTGGGDAVLRRFMLANLGVELLVFAVVVAILVLELQH